MPVVAGLDERSGPDAAEYGAPPATRRQGGLRARWSAETSQSGDVQTERQAAVGQVEHYPDGGNGRHRRRHISGPPGG